jgi:hypothetical protein
VEVLGYLFWVLQLLQEPALLEELVTFLTPLYRKLKIQALDARHMMMTMMMKIIHTLLQVGEELLCTEMDSLWTMDH